MKTKGYDIKSKVTSHFVDNTKLRKRDKRKRLISQVEEAPQPMAVAKKLLSTFGTKNNFVNEVTLVS